MRMNRYLASTLLTGLLVTAAIISPAQGQEQSLQPQGAWALTKVDRSAQGGNSYCTLSRKYDQDIVLSLGRNQTEEYSLAVDFQKQTFEKGKSLKISLQPGPGQIRAYDMMPTSDKALVIRLGWDEGFFDTLNKSQQMKIKIADKSYAFAMPEIAKGQGELQDCMEGLKAAAKGGAPAAQTKDVLAAEAGGSKDFNAGKADEKIAVAAAEKSVLQSFVDGIKVQEQAAKDDEDDIKRKNFGARKDEKSAAKKAAANEPVKTAKTDKAEAPRPPVDDAPAPELIKRPAPAKPDNKAPASLAAAAPVVPAPELPHIAPAANQDRSAEELASMQKRLEQLAGENAALKQKASANAAPSAETQKELAALETEKNALEARVKALEAKVAQSARPEDVAKTQARAQELEIKNAQLEESLRNAQVRIGETAVNTEAKALRKIADLEVKLEAAKSDNAKLAKQLETARVQSEDGRLGAVAGDWNLEQATKRYNEAEREVQRLSQQLEQERMSCNREKAQIEQMLFDPAVTDKKQIEKLTQLQKELDDAHAMIKDSQKLVQAAVDQQVAAKTQEMAAKAQAAESEKAALAQQVALLQQSVAGKDSAVKAENDGLKTQMAALQKSLGEKEQKIAALQALPKEDPAATAKQIEVEVTKARAAADQQVATIRQTLAAKDQEIAALKAAPKADPNATAQQIAAEVARIRAPLDAEIATLRQNAAAKDQQIAAIQATPRTDPAILKQVAEMQTSMAALRSENEALRGQVADVTLNGGARADQVASLQLQVNELKDQISRKDTQNLTYQNQIATLQQAARQAPAADNSAQVADLKRQIQGLQKQVGDMQGERSASAAQYASVQPAAGGGAVIAAAYAPPAAAASSGAGYDAGSIKSLLQKAGLSVGGVSKTSGMPGAENFGWTDGSNVKGVASVKMSSGSFDSQVSQYIAQQKSQCGGGDFASMPSPSNSGGVKRTALYETACVSGGSSVSSSLIFFEDQGRFIAISNQIDAADMDIAMDSRDKIAGFVRGL